MGTLGTDCDNEAQSHVLDSNNDVAKRVLLSPDSTVDAIPSGLSIGGLITPVTLNSTTWTALPATALTDRNGMGFQNPNGVEIKINFATVAGFVGWSIKPNGEFFIDVSDAITIYAKSASGTPEVIVMEVA